MRVLHAGFLAGKLSAVLRWYFARAYATVVVAFLLVAVFGVFWMLAEAGQSDAINLGLILQGDWFRRGGLQWVALFTNGFVTFSLDGLAITTLFVLVGVPWMEKRLGSAASLALVLGLASALGPIKIALGGPGAVGPSKFTLMIQTFWLADNPLLLWLAGRLGLAPLGTLMLRGFGWAAAVWLAWGLLFGYNAAHTISVAVGLALATFVALRRPPWLPPTTTKRSAIPAHSRGP